MQVSAAFLCGFRSDQLSETADVPPVNLRDRGNGYPARRLPLCRPGTVPLCRAHTVYSPHHLHPTTPAPDHISNLATPFSWERQSRHDAVADI